MAELGGFREFLARPVGKAVAFLFVVAAVAAVVWAVRGFFLPEATVAQANAPLFIDAETGKTFHQSLTDGMHIPVKSPYTGKETGYKAELCYWTKDGKPKDDPTPVLMNSDIGKPGPTFCPDCGRLVVHHNPKPRGPDSTPPPTQAEYQQQHGS